MRVRTLLCLLAAGALLAPAGATADAEVRFQSVIVKQGDTLWSIANTYLKEPSKWDELLKFNKIPSSDPTVALPGMTLRVPIYLIKENLRAAHVVYLLNKVVYRREDTADWKGAALEMQLFKGDTIRTQEASKAKVRFLDREMLSLDPNSMAVIKPPRRDYDVELKTGAVFVGRSKVVTASATITPKTKDTQYSAKVKEDLSTLVEVYTGLANVAAQGRSVDVKAGMSTEVKPGLAPRAPVPISDLPEFEARAAEFTGEKIRGEARLRIDKTAALAAGADAEMLNNASDIQGLRGDVMSLSVGIPISAYRVQAARDREFEKIALNKVFEPEDRVNFRELGLASGVYWFRVSLIDLLGTEAKPSAPRLYSVGLSAGGARRDIDLKESYVLYKPAGDEDVRSSTYRVSGLVKHDGMRVSVNGRPARQDETGNFAVELKLKPGENDVVVTVVAPNGNSTSVVRRVTLISAY